MEKLLKLLKQNALESSESLSKQLDMDVGEVEKKIAEYKHNGVIRGYQAVIDEDKLDQVTIIIEVQIVPESEGGFDRIATHISEFPEVQSLYLMSGTYDLLIFIKEDDMHAAASFVSQKLATIKGIKSTATHFKMKTYKQNGILMHNKENNERLKISP